MIVDDLDVRGPARGPREADAVLLVNANAMLPLSVASQSFQPIARRGAKVD
jgi:hypothetical protein